jgi:sigma-54 specific flagellar transcriptional regulator A
MQHVQNVHSPIIGDSLAVKRLRLTIEMVAQSNSSVLITGPTGTGKELVAQEIHRLSARKGEMIALNCSAIPSELLESELFGFERGAFTGADKVRVGRFEQSSGGTLFLDEIGDMPLALQAKMLRAIEEQTVRRLGGNKDISLNLRIVCATHKDLSKMVETGEFRADLFYRLAVFPIGVPSLSERLDDVPALLNAFMTDYAARNPKIHTPVFSEAALAILKKHDWPGNIRELRNVIERAFVMFSGREIMAEQVRDNLLRLRIPDSLLINDRDVLWEETANLKQIGTGQDPADHSLPPDPDMFRLWFKHFESVDLRSYLRDIEVVFIESALEANDMLVSRASDALGLRRTTLIEKMKKFGIDRHESR